MRDLRSLSPRELELALSALLGEVPADLSDQRAALEALGQGGDPLLLTLRELESATDGLPHELDGWLLGRPLAQDPISVTVEAWGAGQRHAIRLLRPQHRADPVWRRRLERSVQPTIGAAVLSASAFSPEPWPHLRLTLGGPSLADLLPIDPDDPPDSLQIARFLAGGLLGLERLHGAGLLHGGVGPEHLVQTPDGVKLAWLDPVLPVERDPTQDLAELGRTVSMLDPTGSDPIGVLARGLAEGPPPTALMAQELLRRAMSAELADRRHRVALRARLVTRKADETELLRLARRLGAALPPPAGRWVLRAGNDAVMVLAESDGEKVRGGPVAGLDARFLPTVWSDDNGLDAVSARALMRAWATRRRGNEQRRAQLQGEIGADDDGAQALCRWLSAQSRLRAVRMLMECRG